MISVYRIGIYGLFIGIFLPLFPLLAQKVEPIDVEGYQQLIQDHQGTILVVNFWATWCIPCREEFPELVRFAKTHAQDSLKIVGISIDYPDEVDSKIIPFLKQHQVNFVNYVKAVEDDEAFINLVNHEWSGALPATAIYDRKGTLQFFHIGKIGFDTLEELIQQLRGKPLR